MNTTLPRSATTRGLQSRRARHSAAVAGVLAATGAAFALVQFSPSAPPPERPSPASAESWPGALTASEQRAVAAALGSSDARTRRIAVSVAAGEAGASALADPAILRHYGVDTAALAPRDRGTAAAARFHNR